LISILGTMGTLLGLVRAVPQLLRLLRSGRAFGVSVDAAATSSIVSFGWAVYGWMTGQPFVSLATGSSGLVFALISLAALRYGRSLREFRVAPAWLLVLSLAYAFFGRDGLGFLLPVSVLASNLPQLVVAYREGNLADLSLSTWLFGLGDGLIWGTYAMLRWDVSILIYGGFQICTSGLIVVLKLAHARQARIAAGE
jgi:uncharacterized protein with PQ loop repeat